MLLGCRPHIVFEKSQLYQQMVSKWTDRQREAHEEKHLNGGTDWHCVGVLLYHYTVSPIHPSSVELINL